MGAIGATVRIASLLGAMDAGTARTTAETKRSCEVWRLMWPVASTLARHTLLPGKDALSAGSRDGRPTKRCSLGWQPGRPPHKKVLSRLAAGTAAPQEEPETFVGHASRVPMGAPTQET